MRPFSGSNTLDQYWTNLANGVESIAILTQEEMSAAGIPEHISRLPGYVNASPVLDDVDMFDAQFFGFLRATPLLQIRSTDYSLKRPGTP